jgi:hypothetical protein
VQWRWIVGGLGVLIAVLWGLLGSVGLDATSAEQSLTFEDRLWALGIPLLLLVVSFGLLVPRGKDKERWHDRHPPDKRSRGSLGVPQLPE